MIEKTSYDPIEAHKAKRNNAVIGALVGAGLLTAAGLALHLTEVNPSSKSQKEEKVTIEGMMNGEQVTRGQGVLIVDGGVNIRKSPDAVNDDNTLGTTGNKAGTVKEDEKLVVIDPIRIGDWFGFTEAKNNEVNPEAKVGDVADQLKWVYAGPENANHITFYGNSEASQNYGAVIKDGQLVDASSEQSVIVAQGQFMSEQQAKFMVDALHSQTPQKP